MDWEGREKIRWTGRRGPLTGTNAGEWPAAPSSDPCNTAFPTYHAPRRSCKRSWNLLPESTGRSCKRSLRAPRRSCKRSTKEMINPV